MHRRRSALGWRCGAHLAGVANRRWGGPGCL